MFTQFFRYTMLLYTIRRYNQETERINIIRFIGVIQEQYTGENQAAFVSGGGVASFGPPC